MRVRLLGLGLAAVAFIGTVACDEALSSLTGPTPNLEPTFTSIQRDILQATDTSGRLACVNCHNGVNVFAPGNFTAGNAYASLVGVTSVQKPSLRRVDPGNPESSYILHKLEGRSDIVGQRMPRGTGPFLTDGQILVIRRWIELGAPNN
jgi:hypothetical protein